MICGVIENDRDFAEHMTAEVLRMPDTTVLHWESGESFWRDPERRRLDMCFVDLGLPGISGIDVIGLLQEESPSLPCVVISALHDDEAIVSAVESGACGYIWKGELKNIPETIEIISSGGALISPSIAVRLLQSVRKRKPAPKLPDLLSPRETQVFQSITEGMTPRQVALTLHTSEGTVRNQIKSIYRKLRISNRVEMMQTARRYGLI